jgi:hypothetical protein
MVCISICTCINNIFVSKIRTVCACTSSVEGVCTTRTYIPLHENIIKSGKSGFIHAFGTLSLSPEQGMCIATAMILFVLNALLVSVYAHTHIHVQHARVHMYICVC